MGDRKFSSIFWPLLLIGLGVLWLLSNLELLPRFTINTFLSLWPLILIAVGANLLLAPRYPWVRPWIAVGAVLLAFGFALAAPNLGISTAPELKEAHFSEALGDAETAAISLDLSIGKTEISALSSGSDLIVADVTYLTDASLEVDRNGKLTAKLKIDNEGLNFRVFNFFSILDDTHPSAQIQLNPDVPLDLMINGAVGDVTLDLSGLTLTSVTINGGVGAINLILPGQSELYTVDVDGGVGSITITIEEGANVELDINGGVGDFRINLPSGDPIRLDAETEIGGINVASFLDEVSQINKTIGEKGVWESSTYFGADERISIEFRGGVGGLRVR